MITQVRTQSWRVAIAFLVLPLGAASNTVLANTPRLFDQFGKLSCSDELIRLHNYGLELQRVPEALAIIVVYGGQFGTRHGEVSARLFAIRDVLIRRSSVDTKRIRLVNGGFRESFAVDLWIAPSYGQDPAGYIISNLPPSSIRLQRSTVLRWDYRCERKARPGSRTTSNKSLHASRISELLIDNLRVS